MKYSGRIFMLDDDELIISMLSRALRGEGYDTMVETTGEQAVKKITECHPDLVLLDVHLDNEINGLDILAEIKKEAIDTQVVMLTADDTAESAIAAMKLGAVDYLTKPFNVEEVKLVIKGLLEKVKLKDELEYLRKSESADPERQMVGTSVPFNTIRKQAEKLAAAGAQTVLITGESGTGKEVLARFIHSHYSQMNSATGSTVPFIAVNCTALPAELIESELFGHTKYAFTDARTDKKGMFELANGGVLLLDEIGDMRFDMQSKLLRVIEDHTVRRLGGKADIPLELMVIVTTNKNLEDAVAKKEFRDDLFFRLNTFHINIPPLRERKDDIVALAQHFLQVFSNKYQKNYITSFSKMTLESLASYRWPGNIRELRNVIERSVVLGEEQILSLRQLPSSSLAQPFVERRKATRLVLSEKGVSLEDIERDLIGQALALAQGNQTKAAKLLSISYDTLRYQVKKYDLLQEDGNS